MSTGVLMVAADVAPVREYMQDNKEGLLVDIYDHAALVRRIEQALANPESGKVLRKASRAKMVSEMDARTVMFPKHLEYFEELVRRDRAA
jgi:glycosyltransferase involved in cell wall biosynthesis